MKTFLLLLLLVLLSASISNAQSAPTQLWDAAFGGNENDELKSVINTSDGGYLLGGWSGSAPSGNKTVAAKGGFDYWIVRINASGQKLWDAVFGGEQDDYLTAMTSTNDGGFILAGYSASGISGDKTQASSGEYDYWVVKLNSQGTKQWDISLGGNAQDMCHSILQTTDGGYLVSGTSESGFSGDKSSQSKGLTDYWIVKLNGAGAKQWDATFGGAQADELKSVKQTPDGFLLAGSSESWVDGDKTQVPNGSFDYWLVKVDNVGAKIWDRSYGGSGADYCETIEGTQDGGFIVGGFSNSEPSASKTASTAGNFDYWIVRIDAMGQQVWDKSSGGTEDDRLYGIAPTGDGGFLLGGKSLSPAGPNKSANGMGDWDYWIVKISAGGLLQWDQAYGGSQADELQAILFDTKGGIILAGSAWTGTSGHNSQAGYGGYDFWFLKAALPGSQVVPAPSYVDLSIAPNPVAGILRFTVNNPSDAQVNMFIVDAAGSIVKKSTLRLQAGKTTTTLPVSDLAPGIYFMTLSGNQLQLKRRFVKQ